MRFLGKYELLEQLTVGVVETFVAYPIGGGERLLVHVFALPALIKSAPTNRDLLGYMEAMSPPALGGVLDAGRYDDGSQAYVVTKFPRDLSALPKWVETYKAMSKKQDTTAETPARDLWEGRRREEQPPPASQPSAGEFTRAFQAASASKDPSQLGSISDAFGATEQSPPPSRRNPDLEALPERTQGLGSVTQQFMAGLGEGAQLSGSSLAAQPEIEDQKLSSSAATSELTVPSSTATLPAAPEEQPGTLPRPGEFTMFFTNPLAAPSVPSEPVLGRESQPELTPRPSEGDFTQIFGASRLETRTPAVPEPLLEPVAPSGSFTNIFGKTSNPLPAPKVIVSDEDPLAKAEFRSSSLAQETLLPAVPPPLPPPTPAYNPGTGFQAPARDGIEGATRIFRPAHEEPPAAPSPPGESEYTRIVSAKAKPVQAVGVEQTGSAGPGAKLPSLSPAAFPPPTQLPSPAMAVPPPVPAVKLTPPAFATPKVPKLPSGPALNLPKKSKGWATYAPLIVILNLLLLAGISLVLYFVLKH